MAPYTPEMVERICGSPREKFLKVCELIAETAQPDKAMTSLYALGWTQHSSGSQNIRGMCVIQTLLGNMGMAGGGINAGPIGLGVNWSRRATAFGPQQGVGFSVRLGG